MMPDLRLGAALLGVLAALLLASVDQLYRFTLWLYGRLGCRRFADSFEKSRKLWTFATKLVLVGILVWFLVYLYRE